MSILLFLLVLFLLVLVHELGHFWVAKKTGMRVDEFGIGFPPKVKGIKKGETEYTFNLFPIGGFVKIFGEDPAEVAGSPDVARAFGNKSKWAQAAVLVAGVTANVLFAWFLFVIVLMLGVPTQVEEAGASDSSQLIVTQVLPDSPAEEAGLVQGAVITGLSTEEDTLDTLHPSTFSSFTNANGAEAMTITYKIGDEEMTTVVTPVAGITEDNPERKMVGVALGLFDTVSKPFHLAMLDAVKMTGNILMAIVVGISTLLYQAVQMEADFSQVAGPVGIVGLVGDAAEFGFTSLLMFTALISLNLAVINLLPFPALDGGRLLFVGIEALIRRPIDIIWASRLNAVGFVLLIVLMVVVTYNDILRLL